MDKKEYNQKYYLQNKEKIKKQTNDYYRKNKVAIMEKRKPYQRRYREEHKEQISQRQKEYYKKHREERLQYDRNHYKINREKILKRNRTRTEKLRISILKLLGSKCVKCGFDDVRALQIDHTHGGGRKDRKRSGSSRNFYQRVLKEIKIGSKDYQLLCANCNWIKRLENNEQGGSIRIV